MVFIGLGLGFAAGLTLPFLLPYELYMFTSANLLRPHLDYREKRSKLPKDYAVTTRMLDNYLKDFFKSTLFFIIFIGPASYKVLIKK